MKLLLDTNAWIKYFQAEAERRPQLSDLLENENHQLFVSKASLWEASIKVGLGKLKLGYKIETDLIEKLTEYDIMTLDLSINSIVAVQNLPPIHGDPFDRIQVCQARENGLDIVSSDPIFERYGIQRHW